MALLDSIFGQAPVYDADKDPYAQPDERESKDLPLHVRACTRRYEMLMTEIAKTHQNVHATQRLLVVIIILLIANKIIDVSVLTGFLGG